MSRRGAVVGAATAALVLFALVAMHGLPFSGTAPAPAGAAAPADGTPAGASHHAAMSGAAAAAMGHDADMAAAVGHDHAANTEPTDMADITGTIAARVAASSDDAGSTTPHSHSAWHLCLAVLVAFAGIALAASVGRRVTDLIARVRGRLVQVLESRALDPPTQAGLCLLRC